MQFGFANVGDDSLVCEFMIGRDSSNGEHVITYFTQHGDADELELAAGTDYAIVLAGDRLNHELRVPAKAFFTGGKLEQGKQITACIVLCQNNDGYIHVQVSSGLSNGRNIAQFAVVTLGAPIEGPPPPPPEPEPETPAAVGGGDAAPEAPPVPTRPAPATGDAGMIAVVALLAAAAAGIIVFKKKSTKK